MNLSYLVETDWAVHYLRGEQDIIKRLDILHADGLAISVLSLAELYRGVYLSNKPLLAEEKLNDFLTRVEVLGINAPICKIYGKEHSRLQQAGQQIDHFDLLIGITCLYHQLTLLTNNRRHFERIEALEIVSL